MSSIKKHVFIIVRYSMLTNNGVSWLIGKDLENYKLKLFNAQRLSQHEKLFEMVTLPSIVNQNTHLTEENFTLLILTSNELPVVNLENLKRMLAPYPWAKIVSLPSDSSASELINSTFEKEIEKFNEEVCYATVRLDDDDGISKDYLDNLYKYMEPAYDDMCLSFGKGITGIYDSERGIFSSIHEYYQPKIAIGLAHIKLFDPAKKTNRDVKYSIYQLGNHTKVDLVTPTIVDSRNYSFFRTIHLASDSTTDKTIKKIQTMPVINLEETFKLFGFEVNLLANSTDEKNNDLSNQTYELQQKYKAKEDQLNNKILGLEHEIEELTRKLQESNNKNEILSKQYKNILNSRSWKCTKPLRKIKKIFNKK